MKKQAGGIAAAALATLMMLGGGGAAAQEALKVGDRIGDWTFQCRALTASETRCALVQNIVDNETNRPIIGVVLRKLGQNNEKLGLFISTPLGIFLGAGIAAKVDEGEQFPLILQTCTAQNGCLAAVEIDAKRLEALRTGSRLLVGFKARADAKTLTVPVSLNGVKEGLKALETK
jgi:invasion protein IalB